MPRSRFVALVGMTIVLLVCFGAVCDVSAQATPASRELCTIAGREPEAMASLLATPVAEAAPRVASVASERELPTGTAVDQSTQDAIHASMEQFIDCANAGAAFRSLNLVSDAFLRAQLGSGPASADEIARLAEVLREAADASPVPRQSGQRTILADLRDVRLLEDGRVGAIVVVRSGSEPASVETGFYIFQREANRWLIDAVIAIIEQLPATPAA